MSAPRLYVTGTDTGIGKTFASTVLLHALRAGGARAVGMKPVASGCERVEGEWRNEDALALQAASDPRLAYARINPYALPLPLAPELAAREAGVEVRLDVLVDAYRALATDHDTAVVVEGVGGWLAPLSATLEQGALARALELPVVMVVGMRLGCLNHARLTERAIATDGCRLVGWIANHVDPAMERQDENVRMLTERLQAPCWGRLPFAPDAAPETLANLVTPR